MNGQAIQPPSRGRPSGTYGPVALALCDAASSGPGAVRDLCARAQVAYGTGRYTASRLVDAGELVVLRPGRPAVLGRPDAARHSAVQDALAVLAGFVRSARGPALVVPDAG